MIKQEIKLNALDVLNTSLKLQQYQHQRYSTAKISPELDNNVLHMQIALDFLQNLGYTISITKDKGDTNE